MEQPPKDQNCMIHVMEAFSELYPVWPDERLRERLQESLTLVKDTIRTEKNYLKLFFERDWTPISYQDSTDEAQYFLLDNVSFGHDVETVYLMLEAARALDTSTEPVWNVGKKMVDHALDKGWDEKNGGFYLAGFYTSPEAPLEIVNDEKTWWAQAEAMNMFLEMANRYPEDPRNYYQKFEKTWNYTQEYLIDEEHGGWYRDGLDTAPDRETSPKSDIWKATYHTVRAYINNIQQLKEM